MSALRVFRLIASEVDNKYLGEVLTQVADDIQGGSPISKALARHPKVFSTFYVNMVRSGEEPQSVRLPNRCGLGCHPWRYCEK